MPGAGRRVFIVAGIRLFREGLASALQRDFGIAVAGTAPSAAAAAAALREDPPDVVLLDTSPDADDAIRVIVAAHPSARVVALGPPRDTSLADVAGAIDEAAGSPRIATQLLRCVTRLPTARAAERSTGGVALTRREREIVALIDEGLSNKEIARQLVIEVATVKNHVHNILEKLCVESRGEAAAAIRRGI
jgi:two-component system nitrate/nitrite response regulator NarL